MNVLAAVAGTTRRCDGSHHTDGGKTCADQQSGEHEEETEQDGGLCHVEGDLQSVLLDIVV
jgi:hypothetical protein